MIHSGQYLFGLNDRLGNVILPMQYDQLFPIRIVNDSCGRMTSKFILTEGNFQCVYDAVTHQKSKKYQYLYYSEDHFLFSDSLRWGIMDTSLQTILEYIPGEPSITTCPPGLFNFSIFQSHSPYDYFQQEEMTDYEQRFKNEGYLKTWPGIFLYKKDCSEEFASAINNPYPDAPWNFETPASTEKFGLFDLQSKKLIPPIYIDVCCKALDKELYYWCTVFKQYTTPIKNWSYQGELHIYDQSLNLIKKLPFHTNPIMYYDVEAEFYSGNFKRTIYPVENRHHQYGAIDARGTTVLRFKYDSIVFEMNHSYYFTHLKAAKNKAVQLLDKEGNASIPGTYIDIKALNRDQRYYAAKTDYTENSWHLISNEGRILTPGFEQIFQQQISYLLGIPYEYRKYSQPVFCAIKNNHLYLICNEVPYLCDSSHFDFKAETIQVKNTIINKKGEILYQGNQLLLVNQFGYVNIHSGCTTLITADGKQKLEIDLPFSEIDWINQLVCLKSEEDFVTFDLRNWKWVTD